MGGFSYAAVNVKKPFQFKEFAVLYKDFTIII